MYYLKISKELKDQLLPLLKEAFPTRMPYYELNHYHGNRFILIPTVLNDDDIHYEYYQGFVELHLEGKYNNSEYNPFWRALVEESQKHADLSWHNWQNRNQGRCRYDTEIRDASDIVDGFKYLASVFDPILVKLSKDFQLESEPKEENDVGVLQKVPIPDVQPISIRKPAEVIGIKDLPFDNLEIPKYQRPYKWGVKNVNQLITDLQVFSKSKEYRLGTLVLHDNEIVDGQQRIITLSLLLYALFQNKEVIKDNSYQDVRERINIFWQRTKFKNAYSIANVRENLKVIKERRADLDKKFLDFLLNHCEFVVVQLSDIAEAFQFFDSQNARGKDLEPHDLLKAFHLREIKNFTKKDGENITTWQDMNTDHLATLFLSMFRVKQWARNNEGRTFTKDDVGVFKGISLDSNVFPYYMQQIVCHYFADIYQNDLSRKIDRSTFEFPFQLDQICINGSRFFDMVRHYDKLYSAIISEDTFIPFINDKENASAYEIVNTLNSYDKRNRQGDVYVRQLFDCLLMYYVDRFGYDNINKVARKLFCYTYRLRLEHYSVQLSTVDNEAIYGSRENATFFSPMFRIIRDAKTPYDILGENIRQANRQSMASNSDGDIKNLYNKLTGNE